MFAGCTSADHSSRSAIVRDSAGVLIAENPSDASGEEWRLQLPAVLEIGRSEGEGGGPDLFGFIARVIRLSSWHIAVADGLAGEIRVFDEDGSPLLTFGRRGEGPGEFTSLWSIAELTGDSIAAIDNLGGRISLFTSAGAFARSFPIPRLPGAPAPNVIGWLEDGTLLIETLTRSPSRDTRDQSTHFLYAVDRHGEILETLGKFAGSRMGRNGFGFGFGSRAEFAAGGTYPVHGMLLSDGAGGLWVQDRYPSDLTEDSRLREWDVFDTEGRLTSYLTTPNNLRITDIGAQFVLGIHSDALGVETARMYRLLRD